MAFPQVASTTTGYDTANQTSHPVVLPATINSGDLLIIIFGCDDDETVTWPNEGTDWIQLIDKNDPGTGPTLSAAYREADGTEGGTTVYPATGSGEKGAWVVYRITGAEDPDTEAPESSSGQDGSGTGPNPDSLSPSGGSDDYLWIACGVNDDGTKTLSAYPTGYTDNQQDVSDGSAGGCRLYTATKEEADSSDDPAAFTISASENWVACTLAVPPAAAAVGDEVTKTGTLTLAGIFSRALELQRTLQGDL